MKHADLKRTLLIDAAMATALVGCVLIVAPGLAIVGLLAMFVLVVGGTGFLLELGRSRRRPELGLREER